VSAIVRTSHSQRQVYCMKVENWERTEYSHSKTEWKHKTNVRILLQNKGGYYTLTLYDPAGIAHYNMEDSNRSKLEQTSVKWQRDYNRHLKRKR